MDPERYHLRSGCIGLDTSCAQQYLETCKGRMRAMRPFKDASKCIGVKKNFRGGLRSGDIQALQQQQVAIAAEIRDEDDQGIGFVRRLVPLAEI